VANVSYQGDENSASIGGVSGLVAHQLTAGISGENK
jgi:hypothetical protein